MPRAWRWTKRILLGVVAFVVVAIGVVIALLHTDWGRDVARRQVEARLNTVFVGGARIGSLDGSVFGTMVVRDLVIRGPDGQPAITVAKLSLGVPLLPLFSKQLRVTRLRAEGVDVDLRRDPDGTLQITHLTRPGPTSRWAVHIPELAIARAHVRLQGAAGAADTNLDDIAIGGDVHRPTAAPLAANVLVSAVWRERAASIWIDAAARRGGGVIALPHLIARVGDVHVTAAGVHVAQRQIAGLIAVDATTAALARLVPAAQRLPVDALDVAVVARPAPPFTHLDVAGTVDRTPLHGGIDAQLAGRRARGWLVTGTLDAETLSRGAVAGQGSMLVMFDGALGDAAFPAGRAMITATGRIGELPETRAAIAVASTGERATTAVFAGTLDASARLAATIRRRADALVLETGRVRVTTRDPARATSGKAPVHGTLDVDLSASGALSPRPDLAIAGRIDATALRNHDLSIASLKLGIDARHLPSRPRGRAELIARDVQRGSAILRELALDAASRDDGTLAVTLRSRPQRAPWLVEADAVVTPGRTVTIDLVRHHVRAGNGTDWTGAGGRITVAPAVVEVRDVASASSAGALALAGRFDRRSGDLTAHADVTRFALANLRSTGRGTLDGHVDLERARGRFAGVVELTATGVAFDTRPAFDAHAHVEARSGQLRVAATASGAELGALAVDAEVAAPKNIASAAAWQALHRDAIRTARLRLVGLDLGRLAELARRPGYSGRVDGTIELSPTTAGGHVQLRGVDGPVLHGLGPLTADLQLAQPAPDQLQPTLVATLDGRDASGPLARIDARATFTVPARLFDPAAWRLDPSAFAGGTLRIMDVMIEPALLARLQMSTSLRGRANLVLDVAPGMTAAKLYLGVARLRGGPIAQPVAIDVFADSDRTATSAVIAVAGRVPLLDIRARIPVSLHEAVTNPRAVRTAKLDATAILPNTSAPALLATFGRNQITGGTLAGTIDVGGTIARPTTRVRIAGTDLTVPPGPRGRPVKAIDRLAIDATWNGTAGALAVDATQQDGMLELRAQGDPDHLEAGSASIVAKQFDLLPLLAFAPGRAGGAAGQLDAKLAIRGLDPRTAKVTGELHLDRARIPIAPRVGTMWRTKLDVAIGERDVRIGLDGHLGGGTVKANATLALAGATPTGGTATITLRKVSPIGTIEPDIDADVTAKLTRRPDAWVVDLVVEHGKALVPKERREPLDPVGMPDDMRYVTERRKYGEEAQQPESPTLIVNVDLRSTYIESNQLRGYVHGNVTLEADAHAVGIVGKLEAERGDLELFGRRYQVDHAVVRFDGTPDPLLDILVTHDFPEVTTRTQVRGRLSVPELELASDPGTYSQSQLLGFLLGGEPKGQPAEGNPRQAAAAGESLIANRIGGYIREALPIDIDVLRYEAATAVSGPAITVGTWLTRSLFVAYRQVLEARPDENTGEAQIEYWLTRRVVVEGVIGDRGVNGVDLLWRKRY